MLTVVPGDGSGHEAGKGSSSLIDEIVREGARRMLAEALQAEVDAYIAAHAAERGEDGRRLVVRNGQGHAHPVGGAGDGAGAGRVGPGWCRAQRPGDDVATLHGAALLGRLQVGVLIGRCDVYEVGIERGGLGYGFTRGPSP